MAKTLRMIHPEQEKAQKKPWYRLPGEPARYFQLFQRYCQLGRARSLQALWEQLNPAQASTESEEIKNVDGASLSSSPTLHKVKNSVSGTWKKQAALWKWYERAQEYDASEREGKHAALLTYLDSDAKYLFHAQRLDALELLVSHLMKGIRDGEWAHNTSFKEHLAWIKQVQSLLRDIRREMADFNELSRT